MFVIGAPASFSDSALKASGYSVAIFCSKDPWLLYIKDKSDAFRMEKLLAPNVCNLVIFPLEVSLPSVLLKKRRPVGVKDYGVSGMLQIPWCE